jgi:DNA-binding response OmpR family regulator
MKILIVEDEQNLQLILKYNLELDGNEVLIAGNGQEALDLIDDSIDLVLMDVMMPVMNGLEACNKLKADSKTKHIPVFMLTAKSQISDIEAAFQAGADDYLTKPFEPSKLAARINHLLEKFRKSQQNG